MFGSYRRLASENSIASLEGARELRSARPFPTLRQQFSYATIYNKIADYRN